MTWNVNTGNEASNYLAKREYLNKIFSIQ